MSERLLKKLVSTVCLGLAGLLLFQLGQQHSGASSESSALRLEEELKRLDQTIRDRSTSESLAASASVQPVQSPTHQN